MLGGGSKKRAVAMLTGAAAADADLFTHAEAAFALWEMYVRERNMTAATTVANELAREFPENRELATFIQSRLAAPDRKP